MRANGTWSSSWCEQRFGCVKFRSLNVSAGKYDSLYTLARVWHMSYVPEVAEGGGVPIEYHSSRLLTFLLKTDRIP